MSRPKKSVEAATPEEGAPAEVQADPVPAEELTTDAPVGPAIQIPDASGRIEHPPWVTEGEAAAGGSKPGDPLLAPPDPVLDPEHEPDFGAPPEPPTPAHPVLLRVVNPITTTSVDGERIELRAGDVVPLARLPRELLAYHGALGNLAPE